MKAGQKSGGVGVGGAGYPAWRVDAGPPPTVMERKERPFEPMPRPTKPLEDEGGPRRPDSGSPERDNLLKRMRRVDPKQAERYRQRTGQ